MRTIVGQNLDNFPQFVLSKLRIHGKMSKQIKNLVKFLLAHRTPITRSWTSTSPWPTHDPPIIYSLATHCLPVAHLWPTHGPPMAHPWPTHGPPLTHPEPTCGPHCPPADGTLLANSSATIWTCPRQIVVLDSLFVHTLS